MLTVYINVGAHANSLITNEGADADSLYHCGSKC